MITLHDFDIFVTINGTSISDALFRHFESQPDNSVFIYKMSTLQISHVVAEKKDFDIS